MPTRLSLAFTKRQKLSRITLDNQKCPCYNQIVVFFPHPITRIFPNTSAGILSVTLPLSLKEWIYECHMGVALASGDNSGS